MNPQAAESGTEITLPESTFTKDGYIFAGWATSADGTVSYSDKATIILTGNITLYAKWAVTAANTSEVIKNIPADGKVHIVVLVGEISEDTITAISSALYENSDAKINLDMSGTTGLTKIPDCAFFDEAEWTACEALAGIVLPQGIESINESAFYKCTNLTDIVIPDSVKIIGDYAFQCSGLAGIKFGSGLESIGMGAFNQCDLLTKITIPGNVKTIDEMTFDSCSNLEKVVLEEGVQTIGMHAFSYCGKLASVTIPKSVTSIGGYAFDGCDALQSVSYGGTVAEWNALKNDGKIDSNSNDDLLDAVIYCTDGIVTTAANATSVIKELTEGEYNIVLDGTITSAEVSAIGVAIKANSGAKITLDLSNTTNLTEIPINAFFPPDGSLTGCENLVGIIMPDSITSIGDWAFSQSGLKSIKIPDNVNTINNGTFDSCESLESIELPKSIDSIGWNAFFGCNSLADVYYGGTVAEWNALKDGGKINSNGNDALFNATIHCSDGDIKPTTGE